jgi:hypothetical protein
MFLTGSSSLLAAGLQSDQWLYNPMQWAFQADSVDALGRNGGMAQLQAAPVSTRVSIEADLEVAKTVEKTWKIAGVAVVNDLHNFWHFALIESPDAQGSTHACELREMRDGVWMAEQNLKITVHESTPHAWHMGQRYRLRIALDPDGIEGTLADSNGRQLERVRYTFSGDAVRSGRPALRSDGFQATFKNVAATHSDPAPVSPSKATPYQNDRCIKEIVGKKTGFFHVEQQGGVWWTIDPQGRGFVPLGVDHVSFRGHGCEQLGYAPYGRKNESKYANPDAWAQETLGRLKSWGFNLLGAGSSPDLNHRGLAHTVFLSFGTEVAGMGDAFDIIADRHIPCSAFPNVFHPDFEKFCRYRAQTACAPHVGDPWLFGYFLDNELAWWGQSDVDTGLFDAVMRKSAQHTAKRALRDLLAKRHDNDIARFNRAWGLQLQSFDEILERDSLTASDAKAALPDKKAFVALIGERYFDAITKAIRAVDPDHMILGCRFAGGFASEGVWQAAGRHCDILSFNYYGNVDLDRGLARDHDHARLGKPLTQAFQKFYDMGRRPMMVTEWSFPAIDAGLPSIHGAGQRFRTQAERAKATEITARTMLAMPFIVGYDYFMWVDEPALGISKLFPEDSNYGLINEDGRPYERLTGAFAAVHQDSGRLHREGPSRAGIPTAEPPAKPSSLARFFERQHSAKQDPGKPHPSLRFERTGDAFVAGNGPLSIRGKIGGPGLTSEIAHRGMHMGTFNGMVQQCATRNEWIDAEQLADVQAVIGPAAMTLDLTGRYQAPPQSERRSFEVAYRVTLLPDSDAFVAEWLWCRNTDSRPMNLRGIYFRLYSQIAGSAADDVPTEAKSVPRLWGNVDGDAWLDTSAGAFWGLAVDTADRVKIHFFVDDPGGQQHPDAVFELDRILAPGETYRPATPVGVLGVAGRGGYLDWQSQAGKALNSLETRP